jgi:thioredoxin 1
MSESPEPTREAVDALPELTLLEFGASWCPHCQAAKPAIKSALTNHSDVRHLKIEDGKGKRLGRSFAVKLWPTLILMRQGTELARVVRPTTSDEVEALFNS